jgi:SAM-dependent methyltransferase
MVMKVLQDKLQLTNARQELIRRGVSFTESKLRSLMRRIGLAPGVAVGEWNKSWDVLTTLNLIESHLQKNEPILDIGCYASEVIVALHTLGYSNLVGVDLNPDLQKMPYANSIRYEGGNFLHTEFEDASFQAITSISVIEHGFDGPVLLREMSRLLKPGGFFIASFDYWPEKIDTTGIEFFGMDWKIFSMQDVADFVSQAANYGLVPVGEMRYEGKEKVIECGGMKYTFGWLVFERVVRV